MYFYVGNKSIQKGVSNYPSGTPIKSQLDLVRWISRNYLQQPDSSPYITATFVIDRSGYLRLAPRHSEHVACAGNQPVLSAGEITFLKVADRYEVTEISNQSTGYCPEPESYYYVQQALNKIPITSPDRFTSEFIFRLCNYCEQINIVKDNWFLCGVCNRELPTGWNFD